MDDVNDNIFDEWRTADRRARVMEQAHLRTALLALDGSGVATPTANERDQARHLRHVADDLFALAMAELDRRATANRR